MTHSMSRTLVAVSTLILTLLLVAGCSQERKSVEPRLSVFVSIPPYVEVVEAIGGNRVHCQSMLAPSASPATYEPNAKQLAELSDAALYLSVGLPFETAFLNTLERNFPNVKFVDLQVDIEQRELVGHSHAHNKVTSEDDAHLDPHTWLDPVNMKEQAKAVCEALVALSPSDSAYFKANQETFEFELSTIDDYCAARLAPYKERSIVVFHPSFGYFAHRYGLQQKAIEHEGKAPSAKQLQELLTGISDERIGALFVQPQFPDDEAATLALELGVEIVILDPLDKNYLLNLRHIADQFALSFENSEQPVANHE